MEAALNFLAQTDEKIADAKYMLQRSEYLAKLREAFAFKAAEGATIKDREVAARTEQASQDAWERHFNAVANYEKLRARRERAVLTIEIFRTLESSRRAGTIT
jgi:hypothetical protein